MSSIDKTVAPRAPDGRAPATSGNADPAQLQKEVVAARSDLDRLLGELDRRRHALFDLRGQLRRHPLPLILGGLVLATAIGGAVALIVARRRRHKAWPQRIQRLRHAITEAIRHPDRSGDQPSAAHKIGVAGGSAAASALTKAATQRLLQAARGR